MARGGLGDVGVVCHVVLVVEEGPLENGFLGIDAPRSVSISGIMFWKASRWWDSIRCNFNSRWTLVRLSGSSGNPLSILIGFSKQTSRILCQAIAQTDE